MRSSHNGAVHRKGVGSDSLVAIRLLRWTTHHRTNNLRRIGVRLRPEHLRAVIRHLGYVQIAFLVHVDLVHAIELPGQRAVATDIEDVAPVQVVLDQPVRRPIRHPDEIVYRDGVGENL